MPAGKQVSVGGLKPPTRNTFLTGFTDNCTWGGDGK